MNSSRPDPLTVPGLHRLVARWVDGWVRSRAGSTARGVDGGFDVTVADSPKRARELVLVEPTPALLTRYAAEAHPGTWLTLITREPVSAPPPAGLAADLVDELLMTRDLVPVLPSATSGPGVPQVQVRGGQITATLRIGAAVAATGQVGVAGRTATYDRIRTAEAYRRRGLGRQLMAVLSEAALQRGATDGVLAASVEGQALYTPLGWRTAAAMITYARDDA